MTLGQVPMEVVITAANTCERAVLRKHLKKGEFYVADRYYGLDYGFFAEVRRAGASFVFRICNDARVEVEKELALSAADRAVGVIWDGWVQLGVHWQGAPVRLVKVQADEHLLLLVTDQKETMAAELVALIYKSRWQIELFFKNGLGRILGCRHLLAESLPGMVVIICCALDRLAAPDALYRQQAQSASHGGEPFLSPRLCHPGGTLRARRNPKTP